ncbi:MAG: peptidoglycan DD-metalloendopeptidase family protein [Pseudomonadota bacterium]
MRYNYLFSFLFISLLGACSSPYQAPVNDIDGTPRFLDSGKTHLVNDGETLYVIAWMYDVDVNALARTNNLREPYSVSPGQVLSVDLRGQTTTTSTAIAAPQAVARSSAVITNPVQVGGGIQRAPLPSSGISRRELPSARNTVPAAEPPVATTPPTTPSVAPSPPANIPENPLPPVPAPVPVIPPVATIETPPVSPQADVPPVGSAAPVQTAPPVQTIPSAPPPVIVSPPPITPAAPAIAVGQEIDWEWPFRGAIVGRFGDAGVENKGLDLAGNKGDPILAAADGEVVYSGSGLLRYGDLIIIKHNDHFLSAYAHNSVLNVKEGDKVTGGQKIAELGSSGINRNMLHFEIRLDGKPVDPQLYLPAP